MTTEHGLTGEVRRAFETWRALGLSEAAARRAVEEDGLAPIDPLAREVASYQVVFGLSEAAAKRAAMGRHPSMAAARRAAAVSEGRRAAGDQNQRDQLEALTEYVAETRRLMDSLTDAELAEVAARLEVREAPRRKPAPKKTPAKRTTARPAKAPVVTPISEKVRRL